MTEQERLNSSELRSWKLHCEILDVLEPESLEVWSEQILTNIDRLRLGVKGQPHLRNLDCWERLISDRDFHGITRALGGMDRESIEMREVSPMQGILSPADHNRVIRGD